jgi:hypothetical protein
MIIATRTLFITQGPNDIPVPVEIHAPVEGDRCWECHFEIGWPKGRKSLVARGFDSVQALYLAMQRIAFELYASPHHETGKLRWGSPGDGYGFPMAKIGYNDLIGEDRLSQV